MSYKFKLSGQNQLFIFLIILITITASGSLVLAAAPVVMEDHFQIKEIENVEIRAEAGGKVLLPEKLEVE